MNTIASDAAKPAALGLGACIALVVGNMIGSGIFLLPAALASFGPISLLGWILTSGGAIVLAIIFGRLAKLVTKPGGPYAYCEVGYGEFAGFIIACRSTASNGYRAFCVGHRPRGRHAISTHCD